jgi:hypothetical protein
MDKLLSIAGGQPLKAEDWTLMQDATAQSVGTLIKALAGFNYQVSTPVIIVGLEVTYVGGNILSSAGFIWDGSEVCYVPAASFVAQELPDNSSVAGYRLILAKNETTSEARIFKNSLSHNVYRSREYEVQYIDSALPSDAFEWPERMMSVLASSIVSLVPVQQPSNVVMYVKRTFDLSLLDQYRVILNSPGAGKAIQIISLSAQTVPSTTPNVNGQYLNIFYGDVVEDDLIGDFTSDFLQSPTVRIQYLTPNSDIIMEKPVCIALSLGEKASGTVIGIHMFYKIITI